MPRMKEGKPRRIDAAAALDQLKLAIAAQARPDITDLELTYLEDPIKSYRSKPERLDNDERQQLQIVEMREGAEPNGELFF
jgi:hypothetical protein